MDVEKKNQSIVNAALVACGFLAYLASSMIFETLAGTFGPVARYHNMEAVKHGVPVAIGLLTFFALFLNPKIQVFADEAVTEVRKVVWPSRKDTVAMTIVCCVMVVLAGIGLGVYDLVASQLIKAFVN
ncbi:MAG: preprotein translocase subunit SecE [Bdellovibrionales bacterium]